MTPSDKTFTGDFKRFFFRGLAILLPSVLTLWILWQATLFVYSNVAQPINHGLRSAVIWVLPRLVEDRHLPSWFKVTDDELLARLAAIERDRGPIRPGNLQRIREQTRAQIRKDKFEDFWNDHWYLTATGFVVAILLIYLAGVLLQGYLGRKVYHAFERLIRRIPGFKQIYPHVKQVVDLVIGEKPMAFKRVVIFEYPRKGIWTLGFVTSPSMNAVNQHAGARCTSVFVPSTPTPFTGFTIAVPEHDLHDLPISVDEAIRFVLTGGVLIPDRQVPAAPTTTPAPAMPDAPDRDD